MCKYCKKIKEIKDLEVSELRKIVDKWRRRDLQARNLIKQLVQLDCYSLEDQHDLLNSAYNFCFKTWIGK